MKNERRRNSLRREELKTVICVREFQRRAKKSANAGAGFISERAGRYENSKQLFVNGFSLSLRITFCVLYKSMICKTWFSANGNFPNTMQGVANLRWLGEGSTIDDRRFFCCAMTQNSFRTSNKRQTRMKPVSSSTNQRFDLVDNFKVRSLSINVLKSIN